LVDSALILHRNSGGVRASSHHEDDISRNLMHSTNASWNQGPAASSTCSGRERTASRIWVRREGEDEEHPGAAEGGVARGGGRSAWRGKGRCGGRPVPRTKLPETPSRKHPTG